MVDTENEDNKEDNKEDNGLGSKVNQKMIKAGESMSENTVSIDADHPEHAGIQQLMNLLLNNPLISGAGKAIGAGVDAATTAIAAHADDKIDEPKPTGAMAIKPEGPKPEGDKKDKLEEMLDGKLGEKMLDVMKEGAEKIMDTIKPKKPK